MINTPRPILLSRDDLGMCDDNPIDTLSIPTTNYVIESRKIKVKMLMLLLGFFDESNLKK